MIPSIPTAVCSNSGYPSDKKQKFFFLKGAGVGGGENTGTCQKCSTSNPTTSNHKGPTTVSYTHLRAHETS